MNTDLFHSINPRFIQAMALSRHLRKIKNKPVKYWQESLIIKTLLAGLRGK